MLLGNNIKPDFYSPLTTRNKTENTFIAVLYTAAKAKNSFCHIQQGHNSLTATLNASNNTYSGYVIEG